MDKPEKLHERWKVKVAKMLSISGCYGKPLLVCFCFVAVFSTRNLLTSTLLAFANKAARRNLDAFHQQNNSSSFTRGYFQSNIKTRWTNIIQKLRTGFYGDKNFNLVVVFCGIFLRKLLLVRLCFVAWVFFGVFSTFCMTSFSDCTCP